MARIPGVCQNRICSYCGISSGGKIRIDFANSSGIARNSANIAEGMSRHTKKDKARFINQTFGSAIEVINFLIIAQDLNLITEEIYQDLRSKMEKITNQLNSLYNKLSK